MSDTQIKKILSEDFLELVNLYVNLKNVAYEYKNNTYITIASLLKDSFKHSFLALGLYSDNKLVGFITGYKHSTNDFLISGIFVEENHRKKLKLLLDSFLAVVKELGFKTYRAFCYSDNVTSIIKKYSSREINVQYQGDL